jgi:hypothetical protein
MNRDTPIFVAQTGSLLYRGLATRPRPAADCQSAKQQAASLRYVET